MPFTSPNAETEGLLFFNLRGGFKGSVQRIAQCESGTVAKPLTEPWGGLVRPTAKVVEPDDELAGGGGSWPGAGD
jgi:hypothetical protein